MVVVVVVVLLIVIWTVVVVVVVPRGIVRFSSRDVGGDGTGEDKWRRVGVGLAVGFIKRRRGGGPGVESRELGLGLDLGLDEGGEALPETGGADAEGAGEVAKVLLAPHLKHLLWKPTKSNSQLKCVYIRSG